MPPVLVTVSPSSVLPSPPTLIWPEALSVPLFSTPVPVRSISPWSVTGAAGDDGLAQRQLAGAVDGDGAAGIGDRGQHLNMLISVDPN
jgi:hypothetical protein